MHFLAIPIAELATLDYRTAFPDGGPVNVITLADPELPAPVIPDWATERLHLRCHDIDEPIPGFEHPGEFHAAAVFDFFHLCHEDKNQQNWLCACTAGAGRSHAVVAALAQLSGYVPNVVLAQGTYNRLLYRLILEAAGHAVPDEPLVSLVVRVKYPIDRLVAFLLSLERQRWKNWEVLAVTDGSLSLGELNKPVAAELLDRRCRVIQTREKQGRWGHPYRQLGLDEADGEFIGLSNDDNYYVPGYLDQMVYALESQKADLVLCDYLAHYKGWEHLRSEPRAGACDLGCWLARAALVKVVPWTGTEFNSDGLYVEALARQANKVVHVHRPLFVHN